jgi:carboxypeptidase family protein
MAGYEPRYALAVAAVLIVALAGAGCENGMASRLVPTAPGSSTANTPKTFVISGVVSEAAPSNRRIAGARIQVITSPHTFSDDNGAFTLPGVSAGRAFVEVTKDGYQTYEQQIVVANDMQMTITLAPVATPATSAAAATR